LFSATISPQISHLSTSKLGLGVGSFAGYLGGLLGVGGLY